MCVTNRKYVGVETSEFHICELYMLDFLGWTEFRPSFLLNSFFNIKVIKKSSCNSLENENCIVLFFTKICFFIDCFSFRQNVNTNFDYNKFRKYIKPFKSDLKISEGKRDRDTEGDPFMFEEEKKNQAENTTEQSAFYDSPDYARVQGQKERPFDAPYFSQESSSSVQQNGYTDSSRPYYGNPTVAAYQQMHQHYQQVQDSRPPVRKRHMSRAGVITAISICLVLSLALGFGGGIAAVKLFGGQSRTSVIHDAGGSTTNTVLTGDAMSISDVVSSVSESVVQITTESVTTGSIFGQYISEGAGSGVVLTSDGYIVTNHHVIEDANKITVALNDGTEYQATLVGTDSETDVAVIKVEAANLKPATLGDSDQLTVGQTAIVIGNPLGSLGGSVTSGIISALDRDVTVNGETMNLLQTSAAVNPGNSGGGLFNANGYLVGIVNAKYTSTDVEGIGFAIPINVAKSVVNDLIEYGYVKGRIDTGFSVVD